MSRPRSLFEKLWDAHTVLVRDGRTLLYIDRCYTEDASGVLAYEDLMDRGLHVRNPGQVTAFADHFVPSRATPAIFADASKRRMVEEVTEFAQRWGIRFFGLGHRHQGIGHVVGMEQGLSLPGTTIVCGDSHTATHGAVGALAFGIGSTELAQVLTTQANWQRRPLSMRVTVDGPLGTGVTAKDLILHVIRRLGARAGNGYAIEYAGSTVRGLGIEARATICNMSIELGAKYGFIAPDETTFEYLRGRPCAPRDSAWERAERHWRTLASDAGASFDAEFSFDACEIEPTVTWGINLDHALPIGDAVPDPTAEPDLRKRSDMERALAYMGLSPGTRLKDVPIDRIFIGTCTNGRLSDLQAAAAVLRGRKARVPGLVVPASSDVRRRAEAEGLDRVFKDAGLEWGLSGCSLCCGDNGDFVPPGERCASTQNRNFIGRQGPGARTHVMSPAMVAAAAVTGRLTDVRELGDGR